MRATASSSAIGAEKTREREGGREGSLHAPINVLANVADRVRVIERRNHPAHERKDGYMKTGFSIARYLSESVQTFKTTCRSPLRKRIWT